MLKPGENSLHVRRWRDFVFRIPRPFRSRGSVAMRLGSWVPEDMNTTESLPLDATLLEMLPGMWWELLWRWWARLPTLYTPEGKTDVLETSLFWKSSLVREYAVGPVCGTCLGFETCRGSGGQVIDPVRTYLTRYSSVEAGKSGPFPVLFQYFRVLNLLPVPQLLAGCAQWPPPLLPRTRFQTEIRVEPGRAHTWEFRRAETTSECPRTDHSSTVSISRGWE